MQVPTQIRWPTPQEWEIVTGVFQGTLPLRQRVWITNGLGGDDAPFTIPTSAISPLTVPTLISTAIMGLINSKLGGAGDVVNKVLNVTGILSPPAVLSRAAGMVNAAFVMSVGPSAYPDLSSGTYTIGRYGGKRDELLVHEMTHVWQGHNNLSSMTYVINSVFNQCQGIAGGGSRGAAYDYPRNGNWRTFNAEQQAKAVEDWYSSGMPTSGDLWPYIRDYVRKGRG